MAYDEKSFQATINDLKESLSNDTSVLNTNLTSISNSLQAITDHLTKDTGTLKSIAASFGIHRMERSLSQTHHDKDYQQQEKHEGNRNEDQDDIVKNTGIQHTESQKTREGMSSAIDALNLHSIKNLTLMSEMILITDDMRLGIHGIREHMSASLAAQDQITAYSRMMVESITESIAIDGLSLEQMMSQKIELPKTVVDTLNWGKIDLSDPTSPPGTNTGKPEPDKPDDAGEVEKKADEKATKDKEVKLLKGIGDSLKKMKDNAVKVAKGGLLAALTGLGFVALFKFLQSDTWQWLADKAAWLVNALAGDKGIFAQIATALGLLVIGFAPLRKFVFGGGWKLMQKGFAAFTKSAAWRSGNPLGGGGAKGAASAAKSASSAATGATKTAGAVGGATPPKGLAKSGGWTRSLARGSRNIGVAMKNIGKGAGNFFMMLFKGIGRGLAFLGNPKAILGAATLGIISAGVWVFSKAMAGFSKINWKTVGIAIATVGGFAALGAIMGLATPLLLAGAAAIGAIGIALIPFAGAMKLAQGPLEAFGNIFKQLAKVPFKNLALAGPALAAMAVGFTALSAGGLLSGIADAFTNFFSSDPVKKLERIAKAAPGVDLMGRAFRVFLQGVKGFMDFLSKDKLDEMVGSIKSIGSALKTWPDEDAMENMGGFFKYMSAINWGDIKDFGGLKIDPLDKKSTDNWINLLDELDDFMDDGDLPVLVDMFDKLSKVDVGNFDLSKFELKPIDAKQVKHYSDLIDKLIELADESEGSTFVLGDMSGTVVQGGSQYTKKTSTSTSTTIGGTSTTPQNVVREATRTPADSVVQPSTGGFTRSADLEGGGSVDPLTGRPSRRSRRRDRLQAQGGRTATRRRTTREFRIAGEPIGDKLTKKQMSVIGMARQMSEENFKNYPPRIQQMYLEQSTGQTKVSPPKKKPALSGVKVTTPPVKEASLADGKVKRERLGRAPLSSLPALGAKLKDMRTEQITLDQQAESAKAERRTKQKQFVKEYGIQYDDINMRYYTNKNTKAGWEEEAKRRGIGFDVNKWGQGGITFKRSAEEKAAWDHKKLVEKQDKRVQAAIFGYDYDKTAGVRKILKKTWRGSDGITRTTGLRASQQKLIALSDAGVDIRETFGDKVYRGDISGRSRDIDIMFRKKFYGDFQAKKKDTTELTMDPTVKKMDRQIDVVGGTQGQTNVANNSGNTNVNTQHYHHGNSSRTDDPRVRQLVAGF